MNWYVYYCRHTQKAEELIKAQQAKKHAHQPSSHSQLSAQQSPVAAEAADDGQQTGDWAYDPNEPRYCVCNQVSYGEMVGCDNTDVRIIHRFYKFQLGFNFVNLN